MSIGNTTLVRGSVHSLLTAAGLAVGGFSMIGVLGAVTPAMAQSQTLVAGVVPAGSEALEEAVDLLAANKVVQAKRVLVNLSKRENSTSLTDAERQRLFTLLANANRRIKAMDPIDVSLQTAEDSLTQGDLMTLETHTKAVIDAPKANAEQVALAKSLSQQATQIKKTLAATLPSTIEKIHADFEAGHIAQAKSGLEKLTRSGLELNVDQEKLVSDMQVQIVELEQGDTAMAGMLQPGVIKPRPVEPAPAAEQPAPTPPPAPAPSGDPIEQARNWETQSLIAEADQAFEQARMREAAEKYQAILSGRGDQLNPEERSRIEQRLAESKVRMGVTVGSEGQTIDNVIGQNKLKRDQALAEFNNNLEQARRALASGNTIAARDLAAAARVNVNSVREVFSATDLEAYQKQVSDLLTEIDGVAGEIKRKEDVQRAERLKREAEQMTLRSSQDKSRKIEEAIDRVRALQREMKYDEALQVVDQILFLDPTNPTGLVLRDVISDTRAYRRGTALEREKNRLTANQRLDNLEAQLPTTFLIEYPSDWPGITFRRGEPMGMAESEADRTALATLEKKRVPVNFNDTPLASVVSFMNAVTQLNFDVDWEKLEETGINKETLVTLNLTNVPVSTVLTRVLEKASRDAGSGAAWAINDGVVTISTREDINRRKTLQIYDIRDLLIEVPDYTNAPEFDLNSVLQSSGEGGSGQSPFRERGDQTVPRRSLQERTDELLRIITTNVDEIGWQDNGGDVGFIQQFQGSLIITNTPANHRAIHGLLAQLRQIRAMQINVETRFLLVQTDYFEQIGFDLDVYFNGNNNQVEAARAQLPNNGVGPSDFFDFTRGGLQRRVFGAPTDADGDGQPDPTTGIAVQNPSPLSVIGAGQNSLGQAEGLASGNFAQGILSRAPALGIAGQFMDDIQVDFLIKATQSDRRTVTLTAPRLTFTNGQAANIYVATQIAFVSDLEPVVGENAVAFDPTLATVNEGVRLQVDGTISADRRYVTMNVDASVSKILGFQNSAITALAGGVAVNSAATQSFIQRPTTTVTRVQTTVTVPDQGTILLGGQRLITEQEVESGVPVLSKIPIINRFFSNRIEVREESTLLILIKPTVLIQNEEEQRFFPGLSETARFPN